MIRASFQRRWLPKVRCHSKRGSSLIPKAVSQRRSQDFLDEDIEEGTDYL